MTNIVYLNGEFIERSQAKISVLDRGFLFADGIYEVIPAYQTQLFRFSEHMDRLERCLQQVGIKNPYSRSHWQSLIEQVIKKNNLANLSVYVHITRGVENEREHVSHADTSPTVLIMANKMAVAPTSLSAISAVLLEDIRWQYCDIKSVALLANIMLREQAQKSGCQEAILHREQKITEGATSNVFVVKNGEITTPAKSQYILGGITREVVIEIAKSASIKVHQADVSLSQLFNADEVWVCSSTREISPVTQINDKIVGTGKIGAVTQKMYRAFQDFKQTLIGQNHAN